MKVLITGAGGFCGSHLVRYLTSCSVDVHTIGPRPTSPSHHHADPLDPASVMSAIGQVQPSYVLHLAGVSHAATPSTYYAANALYAAGLLQAVEALGTECPVLLAGTSAEYGVVAASQLPITEDTAPRPYNHYGISKLAQTQMALTFGASGLPVVVVRPFNIIGVGMPPYGAVQSFARQIAEIVRGRRRAAMDIGNLDTTRDFVAVDDVVRIYWRLIQQPEARGKVVNVCSGMETSMRDVLGVLLAEAGVPIEVRTAPGRLKRIDVERHYGSTTRLRDLLGDSPPNLVEPTLRRVFRELVAHA